MRNIFLIITCIVFYSCSHYSPDIEAVLKQAGGNRGELEKTLMHYRQNPADSLKYKAACFLIENMKYKYTVIADSNQWINKLDVNEIKDSLLIAHIDNVFMTRNYPWTKLISFPEFCEYLLPYRHGYEPLENWMPIYRNYLSAAIDSLFAKNLSDSAACAYLVSTFFVSMVSPFSDETDQLPSSLLKIKKGDCRQLAMLGCYVMQTLGIPVAWDFTPHWGNRSIGHDWNVLLSEKRLIPFLFGDKTPFGEHFTNEKKRYDKLAKVYRRTFEVQKESLAMLKIKEEIPLFFKDPCFRDVSSLYFTSYDIKVKLTIPPPSKKEIAYIMVFDDKDWQPIHWAKIKKGEATFTKMAAGCMYIAMYYHAGQFYSASDPFYLKDSGDIIYARANGKELNSMNLLRKYPDVRMRAFSMKMIGGCFQGSNNEKFRNDDKKHQIVDTFHVIEKMPEVKWYGIRINNPKKCRYVRYWSGHENWGNIAEIEFYTLYKGQAEKLSGKIIGTKKNFITHGETLKMAFDGDPLTYFSEFDTKGAWVGLDLGKPQSIDSIRFLPRNDDNNIVIGDEYELMYWNNGQWISLGRQIAKGDVLHYANVPDSALFLLHNYTRGKEERIFTYENGQQVWW